MYRCLFFAPGVKKHTVLLRVHWNVHMCALMHLQMPLFLDRYYEDTFVISLIIIE